MVRQYHFLPASSEGFLLKISFCKGGNGGFVSEVSWVRLVTRPNWLQSPILEGNMGGARRLTLKETKLNDISVLLWRPESHPGCDGACLNPYFLQHCNRLPWNLSPPAPHFHCSMLLSRVSFPFFIRAQMELNFQCSKILTRVPMILPSPWPWQSIASWSSPFWWLHKTVTHIWVCNFFMGYQFLMGPSTCRSPHPITPWSMVWLTERAYEYLWNEQINGPEDPKVPCGGSGDTFATLVSRNPFLFCVCFCNRINQWDSFQQADSWT